MRHTIMHKSIKRQKELYTHTHCPIPHTICTSLKTFKSMSHQLWQPLKLFGLESILLMDGWT